MFSVRARILIALVLLGIAVLFVRAVQVQQLQHGQWVQRASENDEIEELIETSRGRILDFKGREMAVDAPCVDAVIDYRVITPTPDEKWLRQYARNRLRNQLGETWLKLPRAQATRLIDEQVEQVKADIEAMWDTLGDPTLTGYTRDQIEDRRQQIVQRVQMRRRYIWYQNYLQAGRKLQEQEKERAWWERWLDEGEDASVQVDTFDVVVGEQLRPHAILPAIPSELVNHLTKNIDRFPGLSLQPGQHRLYPYHESACHLLGYLTEVSADDRRNDPNKSDKLRKYALGDAVGRQGIEALCESTLRGVRGQIRRSRDNDAMIDSVEPIAGNDVRLSVDAELQKDIEEAFVRRKVGPGRSQLDESPLHGAAVIIDVPTGEIRALVSYPTFDVNELDRLYTQLVRDEINKPLLNRATQSQFEPGSTVKPILGIAGLTERVVGIHEGIECNGRLKLGGITYSVGKCWTVGNRAPPHHASPYGFPHRGKFGNPDGFLIYADALERSCNVWCETVADRLGWERIAHYYSLFGLGGKTGIGIPEVAGRVPDLSRYPASERRASTWFAGIGQGPVAATPLQMANVAATLAREGVWVRPNLVVEGWTPPPTTQPRPDRVVLPVSKAALTAAREGMYNVVNYGGGTGLEMQRPEIKVAAKTGTAQAARFSYKLRDAQGKEVGRVFPEISTKERPNPQLPWYRGTESPEGIKITHAWAIGFAPAENPQIAFAVMVEYGGGGGKVAGPVAQAMIDALEKHGYLQPQVANP